MFQTKSLPKMKATTNRLARSSSPRALSRGHQGGIAILEALIAILIFSIGVLGIVGLQARSVQGLGDAGFRSQAVQHANEVISEMWMTDPGLRAGLYNSATSGTRYLAWATGVTSGTRLLPGAASNLPIIVVNTVQTPITILTGGASYTYSDVTVTVRWVAPGAPPGAPVNQYTTTARIMEPQS
jgi:type IV pilus assembly protein PilV